MSSHPELRTLRDHLQSIHDSILHFQPPPKRPPILDSSYEIEAIQNQYRKPFRKQKKALSAPSAATGFSVGSSAQMQWPWLQHNTIPGLKKLRESIKIDLDVLEKFLSDPSSENLPPLSTNAPYLISVWNEVLCARAPVLNVFKSFAIEAKEAEKEKEREIDEEEREDVGNDTKKRAKVDVVADFGKQWIRVNTIKNSRILAEFREIDSYLTDSDSSSTSSDEEDEDYRPSLAQKVFDNSVLRMGRSLIAAANANPVSLPVPSSTKNASQITPEPIHPRIMMRLTRLDPSVEPNEPRIAQTIQELRDMGIDVETGERLEEVPEVKARATADASASSSDSSSSPSGASKAFEPTTTINLDLSILIALVSDLTHSPLPSSTDEANKRFVPPESYLEWKKKAHADRARARARKPREREPDAELNDEVDDDELDLPAQEDITKTTRALTKQLLQEMGQHGKGLLQEMADRLGLAVDGNEPSTPNGSSAGSPPSSRKVEFWTTVEARDRCLRIVSKIGGRKEKQRAEALLFIPSSSSPDPATEDARADPSSSSSPPTLEEAQAAYWEESRYGRNFLPLIPLRFFPPPSDPSSNSGSALAAAISSCSSSSVERAELLPPFFTSLEKTCADILELDDRAKQTFKGSSSSSPSSTISQPNVERDGLHLPRAHLIKASARLRITPHTLQSLQLGAHLGWTTLTANRGSVKGIVKEMRTRERAEDFGRAAVVAAPASGDDTVLSSSSPRDGPEVEEATPEAQTVPEATAMNAKAAIWIVDPRSLAEGMRADCVD